MPTDHPDQLFAEFCESDTKLWIRFVPALPMQAAYYYDAHFGGGVLHRYLLHLTWSGSERELCRISLEIGSHTLSQGALIFNASSASRQICLDPLACDYPARWPSRADSLVRKTHEIVERCRERYGPPPVSAASRWIQ